MDSCHDGAMILSPLLTEALARRCIISEWWWPLVRGLCTGGPPPSYMWRSSEPHPTDCASHAAPLPVLVAADYSMSCADQRVMAGATLTSESYMSLYAPWHGTCCH